MYELDNNCPEGWLPRKVVDEMNLTGKSLDLA